MWECLSRRIPFDGMSALAAAMNVATLGEVLREGGLGEGGGAKEAAGKALDCLLLDPNQHDPPRPSGMNQIHHTLIFMEPPFFHALSHTLSHALSHSGLRPEMPPGTDSAHAQLIRECWAPVPDQVRENVRLDSQDL